VRSLFALILSAAPVLAAPVTPQGLLDALPGVPVVLLGEVHDNPAHHRVQAQAVAALRPAALVFEMLTPAQAARATADLRGDPAALAGALQWAESGWPDFAMYAPIFAAAPLAQVHGGALDRAEVRRAFVEGAAAVFGPEAARYGLDQPLGAPDQAAREALQQEAHCNALPPEMLPGMVAAQRLRDAALARAVVQALAQTGGPVAVITGTGHVRRDHGIPAALALAAPEVAVLAVGQLEADPGADAPFDLWLIADPVDRPDPCAVFRK
jgi:uncharacterized iron-regulated protein